MSTKTRIWRCAKCSYTMLNGEVICMCTGCGGCGAGCGASRHEVGLDVMHGGRVGRKRMSAPAHQPPKTQKSEPMIPNEPPNDDPIMIPNEPQQQQSAREQQARIAHMRDSERPVRDRLRLFRDNVHKAARAGLAGAELDAFHHAECRAMREDLDAFHGAKDLVASPKSDDPMIPNEPPKTQKSAVSGTPADPEVVIDIYDDDIDIYGPSDSVITATHGWTHCCYEPSKEFMAAPGYHAWRACYIVRALSPTSSVYRMQGSLRLQTKSNAETIRYNPIWCGHPIGEA